LSTLPLFTIRKRKHSHLNSTIIKALQGESPEKRTQILNDLLFQMAPHDLGAYGWYLFDSQNSPHKPAPHHEEWIEALNDNTCKRIFIACPRGHAKTSWIGNAYTSWRIGQNKNIRLGYISASEGQAEAVSVLCKQIIQHDPKFKKIFPGIEPNLDRKWTNTNWYVKRDFVLTHPTMFAAGYGGGVLGKRFDEIIIDDLCDQKNMESPILRKKVIDWTKTTLEPCLTDHYIAGVKQKPRIIIIMTRWHEEDLYKWAKDMGDFHFIIQPALGHWEKKKGIIIVESELESTKRMMLVEKELDRGDHGNIKRISDDGEENNDETTEIDQLSENYSEIIDDSGKSDIKYNLKDVITESEITRLSPLTLSSLYELDHKVFGQLGNTSSGHNVNRAKINLMDPIDHKEGEGEKNNNPPNPAKSAKVIIYHGRQALIDHGTALWPDKKSREDHIKTANNDPVLFQKMFQQNPSLPQGNIFKRKWWNYFTDKPFLSDIQFVAQTWDTAFTKNAQSDFSVGYTLLVSNNRIYIVNENRDKYNFPELKKEMKRFYFMEETLMSARTHSIPLMSAVVIEQKGSGISAYQSFQVETTLPIVFSPAEVDKVTRANAITWIIESGRVLLPLEADWVPAFIEELAEFPNAKHDDRVDSLVHGLAYLIQQMMLQEEQQLLSDAALNIKNSRDDIFMDIVNDQYPLTTAELLSQRRGEVADFAVIGNGLDVDLGFGFGDDDLDDFRW